MRLQDILELPVVVDNIHVSVYRHPCILNYVLKMIDRGDSKETIHEIVILLTSYEPKANKKAE